MENGQLVTDLADTPMRSMTMIYNDIPLHWNLAKSAYSEEDCVAHCLAEALNLDVETCKQRLEAVAAMENEDTSKGYTRAVVVAFLQDHSNRLGKEVGWKIIQRNEIVSERTPEKRAPYVCFAQRDNHMYLYKTIPNAWKGRQARPSL